MAADDKKKAVDILLAFGKPAKGKDEPEAEHNAEEEGDEDLALTTAMEEFIAAVKAGDAAAAATAFKSAMEVC